MYFEISDDRILNLSNVNTINIDAQNCRIAFNFNYSINIPIRNNDYKTVSGYAYWNFEDVQAMYNGYKMLLADPYIKMHFVKRDDYGIVNLLCMTSVHFNDYKRNIVINLNNAIYVRDDSLPTGMKNIGNFIYLNFKTNKEYLETKKHIKMLLSW